MIWQLSIDGTPLARAEKRVTIRTKDGRTFGSIADRPAQSEYKAYLKAVISLNKPPRLLDGALSLTLVINRPRPKTAPKRVVYPITKPDWSNYAKLIEDCLTGLVIRDDSCVVQAEVVKQFALGNTAPGVWITVAELEKQ